LRSLGVAEGLNRASQDLRGAVSNFCAAEVYDTPLSLQVPSSENDLSAEETFAGLVPALHELQAWLIALVREQGVSKIHEFRH